MSGYDKFAKQYSKSMSEQGDHFHQTQIDPYIYSIVGKPKRKTIYDIGCGNGYMARNFFNKGAIVFASDLSEKLIEDAKEKSRNVDIQFKVHDATNFSEYEDAQFDVVVMNMVIHYIKDLDKLFKGISKVLKKGGGICVFYKPLF